MIERRAAGLRPPVAEAQGNPNAATPPTEPPRP
jgi:hypothetical protein